MKHHLHLLLAAGFGAISIGAAAAVHDWTATRIGSFDADFLNVVDMNNAGQVAVFSRNQEGPSRPDSRRGFLYTPGSSGGLVDLGSFGGIAVPGALNESGQLVGLWRPVDAPSSHAFIYQNGRMQRLSLPGETSGAAVGINDRGQVLVDSQSADSVNRAAIFNPGGPPTVLNAPVEVFPFGGINNRGQAFGMFSQTGLEPQRSFFYDNGRVIDIGSLGGHTNAVDMNGAGQIVGTSNGQPFFYSEGTMRAIRRSTPAADIDFGEAVDINDRGQVVGGFTPGSFYPGIEGFLYSEGQARELRDAGGGPTIPQHLNELGQVVGFSLGVSPDEPHAFFYSDGKMTDLTQWLRTHFSDVASTPFQSFVPFNGGEPQLNELGQIAIAATLTNGQQTLFVLTPIPEPSTYALMLAGLGVLAWIARRQRGRSIGNRADQTHRTGLAA